ncbi:hypothetical protein BDR07DRAFT_1491093 [Suillus spraguei]|nr:hypothetical protein BDR07DRAFT_1491093 [Suillus spraguei]
MSESTDTSFEEQSLPVHDGRILAMDQAERKAFTRWCENAEWDWSIWCGKWARSTLHSDWGFRPDALDKEHSRPRVLLATGKVDHLTPVTYAHYLAANYENVWFKDIDGGHLGILYHLDEIWADFLADER